MSKLEDNRKHRGAPTPDTWATPRLSEVCSIIYGYTDSATLEPIGPRFLRITDIQDDMVNWDTVPYCNIDPNKLSRYRLQSGDIVFSRTGATTGKSFLVSDPPEAVFASYLIRLRLSKDLALPEFVNYFFQTSSYWQVIAKGSVGSAQGGFNATKLGDLVIPMPPIKVQERIVANLNEAFKGIAATKAIIEKSRANARRLFNSKLQSLIGSPIENWPRTNLGEQTDISTGFPFKSQGYTASDDSMKLLRGDNIIQGQLRWEDVKKWPIADTEEYKDYELREGDVVLAMDRTWVKAGIKYAVLSSGDVPCLLVQRTARLRAKKTLHPKFLRWLIGSDRFTEYVLSVQTGSGVPHISGPQIKAFEFQLPPMKDQCFIASLLDELLSETGRLDGVYSQKLSALDALKQSFLQSAFSKTL